MASSGTEMGRVATEVVMPTTPMEGFWRCYGEQQKVREYEYSYLSALYPLILLYKDAHVRGIRRRG